MVMTLASCGSEFRLAKRFVDQSQELQLAVYFPEKAQVTLIQDQDGTYTKVLDSVSQDMFLDIMYAAYADEMSRYNVNVYIPEDPDNVQVDSLHWLAVLSKVEIQGLYTEYVDYLFNFSDEYSYTFPLNTVNVASWIDFNDGEWHPTQFDEYNLTDDFDSYVSYSREEGVQYHYNITPLGSKDVYNFAVFLGKRYAAFSYNYMLNHFVGSEMTREKMEPRYKLSWDPYDKRFSFQQEGEGFIELSEN